MIPQGQRDVAKKERRRRTSFGAIGRRCEVVKVMKTRSSIFSLSLPFLDDSEGQSRRPRRRASPTCSLAFWSLRTLEAQQETRIGPRSHMGKGSEKPQVACYPLILRRRKEYGQVGLGEGGNTERSRRLELARRPTRRQRASPSPPSVVARNLMSTGEKPLLMTARRRRLREAFWVESRGSKAKPFIGATNGTAGRDYAERSRR